MSNEMTPDQKTRAKEALAAFEDGVRKLLGVYEETEAMNGLQPHSENADDDLTSYVIPHSIDEWLVGIVEWSREFEIAIDNAPIPACEWDAEKEKILRKSIMDANPEGSYIEACRSGGLGVGLPDDLCPLNDDECDGTSPFMLWATPDWDGEAERNVLRVSIHDGDSFLFEGEYPYDYSLSIADMTENWWDIINLVLKQYRQKASVAQR